MGSDSDETSGDDRPTISPAAHDSGSEIRTPAPVEHELEVFRHTRTSAAWVAVTVVVVFGVALIDFIAQNTRDVHIAFFGANGRIPIAVALLVPRARVTLGLALAGLAIADALATPGQQLHYLTSVLPQQASAQVRAPDQYSLTFLLAMLGVGDRAALALSAISSVALLAAGIVFAQRWLRAGERAGIVFAPAACAVIGGSYLHITQIALALPAALLLLRPAPARTPTTAPARTMRALAGAALVLLAVPWPYPAIVKNVLVLSLVSCAIALWFATGGSLRLTVAGVCACLAVLVWAENHAPGPLPPPLVRESPAGSSYETRWRDAIGDQQGVDAFRLAEKVPTWLALLALLTASGLAAPCHPERSAEGA